MEDRATTCIVKFGPTAREQKPLKKILSLKKHIDLASVNEATNLFDVNGYIQVKVVSQFNRTKHPLLGPQLGVLVNGDSPNSTDSNRVIFQGPNVKEFPDNAVGCVLYVLDCEVIKDPRDLEDQKYCLIIRMPPQPEHNVLIMVLNSSEQHTPLARKRQAKVQAQDAVNGRLKATDQPSHKRAKLGKTRESKRIAESEGDVAVESHRDDRPIAREVASRRSPDQLKAATAGLATPSGTAELTAAASHQQQQHQHQQHQHQQQQNVQQDQQRQLQQQPQIERVQEQQGQTHQQQQQQPQQQQQQQGVCSGPNSPSCSTMVTREQASQTGTGNKKKGDAYFYFKLKHLPSNALKVNVFGVVKAFSDPKPSRGTDNFCSFRLVDESLDPHGDICCTLFHQNLDYLPHIRRVGDVVRLHRVAVSRYNGITQINGRKIFSSLVFDGRPHQPIEPRTGNDDFTYSHKDKKRVTELKTWASQQPYLDSKKRVLMLKDIFPGVYFDVVCQIVSTCIPPPQSCGIVQIWDGTKAAVLAKPADRFGQPTNSHQGLADLVGDLCVDVVLYNDHVSSVRSLMPGQYVRMHSVHASCHLVGADERPVVDLCVHRGMHSSCGVTVLPLDDPEVMQLKQRLSSQQDKRVQLFRCNDHRLPVVHQTSATSVCSSHGAAFESIRDVRDDKQVPNKHKIRVKFLRIVNSSGVETLVKLVCTKCLRSDFSMKESRSEADFCPSEQPSTKFYSSGDACPHCRSQGTEAKLKFLYRIKIEVADSTGRMMLLLGGNDADVFLPGLPPCNLFISTITKDQLYQRFSKLSASEDLFTCPTSDRSRPFLECCVKSYYVGGREARVAYTIYDTVLNPISE